MHPEAVTHAKIAKVEEAPRLLSEKLSRPDDAVAPLPSQRHSQVTANFQWILTPAALRDTPLNGEFQDLLPAAPQP